MLQNWIGNIAAAASAGALFLPRTVFWRYSNSGYGYWVRVIRKQSMACLRTGGTDRLITPLGDTPNAPLSQRQ